MLRAVTRLFTTVRSCSAQYSECSVYGSIIPGSISMFRTQLFRAVFLVFRLQHKINFSGHHYGCSGPSIVVQGKNTDVQDKTQLFREVFREFRVKQICSWQYFGSSGYNSVTRGSFPGFQDAKHLFLALFWVFRIQRS